MSTAKVFVTTYGIYNEGLQFKSGKHGYWIDCSDYDAEQTHDDFEALTGEDPEIMFTDYEGFPSDLYSESGIDFELIEVYEDLDEDGQTLIEAITNHLGYDFKEALEKIGEFHIFDGTLKDYAEELAHDCYDLSSMGGLAGYVDFERFGQDLLNDGNVTELTHNTLLISQ